ncbi:unnamed protein product [Taenia asiatica]|uniref:CCHC-type domain-containing protein n=1 Tax=Taenia asiatica TaxID=60517 RepID=A0A0R3VXH8_TAEAS|nr:unnamed protein product [Taenia asiatica]
MINSIKSNAELSKSLMLRILVIAEAGIEWTKWKAGLTKVSDPEKRQIEVGTPMQCLACRRGGYLRECAPANQRTTTDWLTAPNGSAARVLVTPQ